MSWLRYRFRPPDKGTYPMEKIRRRDRPTTWIGEKVPRVPVRGSMFARARAGDLGERAHAEVGRFIDKHPLGAAMDDIMTGLVSLQEGAQAEDKAPGTDEPESVTRHIRSLAYFLGADIVGICEVPEYAWYSHDGEGESIEPRHGFAIVLVTDQGYETMEISSGDDWISGAQSYRAYLQGQVNGSVLANYIRRLGFGASCHSAKSGEVQQLPLMLLAGLGELCRIGEVVLNPYLGPRSKITVVTTDLPLIADKPVDFGLQDYCARCRKCARECPCNAIPWGDKIRFNDYEIWKPDVETCARYRITNQRGSACGRCMKTCPLNKRLGADGPALVRVLHWLGVHLRWTRPLLVPLTAWLDDALGMGVQRRDLKWWLDLEYQGGSLVRPRWTNRRDLHRKRQAPGEQRVAIYEAEDLPPADHGDTWPVDRRQALRRGDEARARQARGKET